MVSLSTIGKKKASLNNIVASYGNGVNSYDVMMMKDMLISGACKFVITSKTESEILKNSYKMIHGSSVHGMSQKWVSKIFAFHRFGKLSVHTHIIRSDKMPTLDSSIHFTAISLIIYD
jgi:hypothetical protein